MCGSFLSVFLLPAPVSLIPLQELGTLPGGIRSTAPVWLLPNISTKGVFESAPHIWKAIPGYLLSWSSPAPHHFPLLCSAIYPVSNRSFK